MYPYCSERKKVATSYMILAYEPSVIIMIVVKRAYPSIAVQNI